MGVSRRSVLKSSILVPSASFAGCGADQGCTDDVACFEFEHRGFDDAPDVLTVSHTGGDALPADEVFITNVAIDYHDDVVDTVPWHEFDDETDETGSIDGDSAEVPILFPDVVEVLWRTDDEVVVGETRSFR